MAVILARESIARFCRSDYKSHIRNFRAGLVTALDKLKSEQVPEGCRVKDYHFSKDGEKLLVLRPGWTKPSEASM